MVRSPGPPKYMLCNCEEGDPGAYNDKGILESDPHTLLEGLIIGGYATRATNGIVFIRHGHDGPIDRTEEAIKQAYEVGLLGENIFGTDFSFDIEVALTGESYVAGEGGLRSWRQSRAKRAQPRFRPPFPAAFGVWGHPSTINNVKTYSYAPEIISRGAEWFSSIGVNRSTGTAIICLNGNVEYPGLYEVPMGMTLGEVVNDIGGGVPNGKQLKLLQTGGPLGGVLSSDSMAVHLDFDEMRDAGAILGLRRNYRWRRRRMRRGPHTRACGLLSVRVLWQVLPLQARNGAPAGDHRTHSTLPESSRRPRTDAFSWELRWRQARCAVTDSSVSVPSGRR